MKCNGIMWKGRLIFHHEYVLVSYDTSVLADLYQVLEKCMQDMMVVAEGVSIV